MVKSFDGLDCNIPLDTYAFFKAKCMYEYYLFVMHWSLVDSLIIKTKAIKAISFFISSSFFYYNMEIFFMVLMGRRRCCYRPSVILLQYYQ